jgi:Flp pilus assembly protein TadG
MFRRYQTSAAGAWRSNETGNVAMIAALAIIPILSVAGLAIDLQLTTTKKNKVQHVVDSAVLAGSRQMQSGRTQSEITRDVSAYVNALIEESGTGMRCGNITLTFADEGQDMSASIKCSQDTTLSQIIGKQKMDFLVSSESTYGIGKVDIAFIFDVSGSMNSSNRLSNLKTAAKIAFDELLPDGVERDGTIRIALTTYNHSVNAGSRYDNVVRTRRLLPDVSNNQSTNRYNRFRDERLLDRVSNERFFYYEQGTCEEDNSSYCNRYWADYSWEFTRKYLPSGNDEYTCVYERLGENAFTDLRGRNRNGESMISGNPTWIADFNAMPGYGGYATYSDYYKRQGQDEIENGGANNWSDGAFLGYPAQCQDSEIMPLTENKNKLKQYVDDLEAGGGTAGHLGVAWGWYLISPEWNSLWPTASDAWAYDEEDMAKAVIIMTDGEFNHTHPTNPMSSVAMAMEYCDAMKQDDKRIQIYTVGFQVPESAQKTPDGRTILEYCATSSSHNFNAKNGEQLAHAYQAIAASISDLRITY